MLATRKLQNRIKVYSIIEIEVGLVCHYLSNSNLEYSSSKFLSNYLSTSPISSSLSADIDNLKLHGFTDLEHALELLIPTMDRSLNGAFFTPAEIVEEIVEEVSPKEGDCCIDPSCGCGAFLIGVIKYFHKKYKKPIREILSENVVGADILDYNINRAKILIAIYGLENGEVISESDFKLYKCDSLRNNWDRKYDVVIGNPPYVKFQDLSDENRTFLKDSWSTIEKGTFNLYFAFFELGYRLLNNKGRLGYITPNNYFTSLSGESLRRFFHSNKSVFRITDFNHYKVFNAQTYTCLTFLNKEVNDSIRFTKMFENNLSAFLKNEKESTVQMSGLNVRKWRLLRQSEQQNIKRIETIGKSLKSLFIINVGIATLKDQLFFIDENKNDKYYKRIEGETFEIEKEATCSIYKISDFSSQEESSGNERRIIFPYSRSGNKSTVMTPKELKTKFPKCFKYLKHVELELSKRTKEPIEPFYMYGRSQGLNKTGIRLLTPTFSQQPKFLLVEDYVSLYCNGYGLHYKEDFKNSKPLFEEQPIQAKRNIDVLQKILNSCVMHYYVTHTSVSIQGGYPCYQKNFIELFSIPDFSEIEVGHLRSLSGIQLDIYLIAAYGLQGLVPNLAEYWANKLGIKEENVRLLIEAVEVPDKNPSALNSVSSS